MGKDQLVSDQQILNVPPSVTEERVAFVLLKPVRGHGPRLSARDEHVVAHPTVKVTDLTIAFSKGQMNQVLARQRDARLLPDLAHRCPPDRLPGLDATAWDEPSRRHPVNRPPKA